MIGFFSVPLTLVLLCSILFAGDFATRQLAPLSNDDDEEVDSLVGTHNTLTYTINNALVMLVKTQRLPLRRQLDRGVRVLDLRFRLLDDGRLVAYHGFVDLGVEWWRVWRELDDWLHRHPNDSVYLVVRDESERGEHELVLRRVFVEANGKLLDNGDHWRRALTSPPRGRALVLNYDRDHGAIPWRDNAEFIVGGVRVSDVYDTGMDVRAKLELAKRFYSSCRRDTFNLLFLNLVPDGCCVSTRSIALVVGDEFDAWRSTTGIRRPCAVMYDWFE